MTFYIDKYNIPNSINNVPENEITLGYSYLNLGLYVDSLEQFNCNLEINSNNLIALVLRGITYFKLENMKMHLLMQAFLDLKILSEFDINSAVQKFINALLFEGGSYYSLEQYNKALLYYDKAFLNLNKALEIDSCDETTLLYCGEAYFKLGHYYKAFYDLEKTLEINTKSKTIPTLRGGAYFYLDQYNNAIKDLNKSLEMEHNNATALFLRGEAFYCLNHFHEAFLDFDDALKFEPNNTDMLVLRGEAYLNLEHYYNAFLDFEKALKILPENVAALFYSDKIYFELEQNDRVLFYSSEALKIDPEFVSILILREALEDFSKALKIEPNNETILKYVKETSNELDFTLMKNTVNNIGVVIRADAKCLG
ncbi:hypothetical protein C2G38_2174429 [Gigaspora rosea]|uniref:Uncharacterized protein n=1 Tax=Gigaspora rosea TaxID=44941 RepID=A0A397VK93_9GLOM|nr:hypothetical protein C2G38_2174429 [Gigaspora rosea]